MIIKITNFIINEVIENTSSFQYFVDFDTIERNFNIKVSTQLQQQILDILSVRDEVADVELTDESFDVVLYTSYCRETVD